MINFPTFVWRGTVRLYQKLFSKSFFDESLFDKDMKLFPCVTLRVKFSFSNDFYCSQTWILTKWWRHHWKQVHHCLQNGPKIQNHLLKVCQSSLKRVIFLFHLLFLSAFQYVKSSNDPYHSKHNILTKWWRCHCQQVHFCHKNDQETPEHPMEVCLFKPSGHCW